VNLTNTDTGNTGFLVASGGNTTTVLPLTYTCALTTSGGAAVSEASCAVTPSPSQSTSLTATVMTTAPTAQLQRPLKHGSGILYAIVLPGLVGIVFAGTGKGKRGMRLLCLIAMLGFSTMWIASCGGSSNNGGGGTSNPGTPAGTYTATVNATTGGASPITGSGTFTVTVQ
jgi:hypothetical protein